MPTIPASRLVHSLLWASLCLAGGLACSDSASGPDDADNGNVAVESTQRVAQNIGPAGGSIAATSLAGIAYRLDIPAGALTTPTDIAITPVRSIANLPYSGGLEGALRCEPDGLVFLKPAELSIAVVAAPSGTQRLIGFSYEGDAEALTPTVAAQTGSEIRVLVTHFSGAGAALAEPDELDNSGCGNVTAAQPLLTLITMCATDREGFFNIMRSRLQYIQDQLQSATLVDDLQYAIALYSEWVGLVYWTERVDAYDAVDVVDELADELEATDEIVIQRLVQGLNLARSQCTTSNLQWLNEFFEFRALGIVVFAEVEMPVELDDATILADLCATAVIQESRLVDPLPLNQDRSLELELAVEVNGTLVDAVFEVTVSDPDNSVQQPTGRTDASGFYTTVVRRLIPEGALFQIRGTLMLPLFQSGPLGGLAMSTVPIEVAGEVFRGGDARITVVFPGSVPPEVPATLSVQVQRLTESGYEPIDGATVDFTVDGGNADPAQAITGAGGIATTQITPLADETNVVIDIAVHKDGSSLGTKQAAAFVEAVENGSIVPSSRSSSLYVSGTPDDEGGTLGFECNGDPGFDQSVATGFGAVSWNPSIASDCTFPEGTTQLSTVVSHLSNPGIATDGRSASIHFETDATVTGRTSYVNLGAGTFINSQYSVGFFVEGGDIAFQIAAEYEANFGKMEFLLSGQTRSYSWTKVPNDGKPTTYSIAGTLPAGHYVLNVGVSGQFSVFGPLDHLGSVRAIADVELEPVQPQIVKTDER